ncbi:Bacterial dnaA protein helix-turn-helix [Chelatococcus sambhunathii]|uniref:Bacterial dnaA protein helix-turn-helix n=1 Tax=Chelatococcus sambhunathii TaxID=363953 RepID=A0ABP2AEL1_9HYPH|nr:hypothetical protein [Chelatococcus sambhunathii]CUA90872.1 Bacterial dnaA protein helix-turn-helix [Chelatococcus sambhunathii]
MEPIRTPHEATLDIIREVAERHGVPEALVRSRCKDRKTLAAKREAIRRVKDERGLSSVKIGEIFRINHTSVLYALGTTKRSQEKAARAAAERDRRRRERSERLPLQQDVAP